MENEIKRSDKWEQGFKAYSMDISYYQCPYNDEYNGGMSWEKEWRLGWISAKNSLVHNTYRQ